MTDFPDIMDSQQEHLHQSYREYLETVLAMQNILMDQSIPELARDLCNENRRIDDLKSYAEDVGTIFRVLKRAGFQTQKALHALQKTMQWRLDAIPRLSLTAPDFLRCLPVHLHDSLRRPVLLVALAELVRRREAPLHSLFNCMELLRRHLHWLNTSCRLCDGRRSRPLLQYEVLLNIDNITVIDLQQLVVLIDLLIRDVFPLYPGLFAAVYVVNHTRAHSHTWFFFKRLLPASARSRVFFPSKSELLEHFSATSLPLDLGGILPSSQLDNPLQMHVNVNENAAGIVTRAQATDPDSSTRSTDTIQTSGIVSTRSTSLSMSNPFYGYPVVYTPGQAVPVLRYGRRRKRDLIYTLGRLMWTRWRRVFRLALYIVLTLIGCDIFQGVSPGKSHLWTGGRSPHRLDARARAQRSRE